LDKTQKASLKALINSNKKGVQGIKAEKDA
jgi:hypothetical protein